MYKGLRYTLHILAVLARSFSLSQVRRAAVQTLLDSPATLVLTSVSGRDFTTPEAELAFERLQDEKAASAAASAAVTKAVALLSRRPSEAGLFTRRPSIASNAPSPLPPGYTVHICTMCVCVCILCSLSHIHI